MWTEQTDGQSEQWKTSLFNYHATYLDQWRLKCKQKDDSIMKDVYKAVLQGVTPIIQMTYRWTATAKGLANDFERLKLYNEVIVRQWFDTWAGVLWLDHPSWE